MFKKGPYSEYTNDQLESRINCISRMLRKLDELNYTLPIARYINRAGIDRYDQNDGIGYYKMGYTDYNGSFYGNLGDIYYGEYELVTDKEYTVTKEELERYNNEIKECQKELQRRNMVETITRPFRRSK